MSGEANRAARLRALRFAQTQAVTERARGRVDEERAWLDMCALLEPSSITPLPGEIVAYHWTRTDGQVFVIDPQEVEIVRLLPSAGRDEWCREEACRHRHWRSGSMPTHRHGADCPIPPAVGRAQDGDA